MKSIKEKAKEYSRCIASSEYTREDFVSGANYVLDVIEDIIVNNEDNTLNMARCLVDCIEQLKK